MKSLLLMALFALTFVGCASPDGSSVVKRRLEAFEKKFVTNDESELLFHPILYYPEQIKLQYDGYIIGVEKAPRHYISSAADVNVRTIPGSDTDPTSFFMRF